MTLGIVGSRTRDSEADKELVREYILKRPPDRIVSGGCGTGADRFAEELALKLGIPIRVHAPDTTAISGRNDMLSRYAARNRKIAANADVLLALVKKPRKGGAEQTIKLFKKMKPLGQLVLR
ncbi:MAG: hypothetical protein AABZ39_12195 [Spirochaetota bacterium]